MDDLPPSPQYVKDRSAAAYCPSLFCVERRFKPRGPFVLLRGGLTLLDAMASYARLVKSMRDRSLQSCDAVRVVREADRRLEVAMTAAEAREMEEQASGIRHRAPVRT